MEGQDKRVDEYISKSADFAKPILIHLRKIVHQACPDVRENIKWGMPYFEYKGLLCGVAGFKNHCTFILPKASLMDDPNFALSREAMGNLGKIKSMADLPEDQVLKDFIRQAARLNEEGIKLTKTKKHESLVVPWFLQESLSKNRKAQETFSNFSYSKKKEYVEWLNGAKTEVTRKKRLSQAIEWLSEGKSMSWKYE